jgi:hypothetical protein
MQVKNVRGSKQAIDGGDPQEQPRRKIGAPRGLSQPSNDIHVQIAPDFLFGCNWKWQKLAQVSLKEGAMYFVTGDEILCLGWLCILQ